MEPEVSSPHSQVPTTCPMLSQLDAVRTTTSHFLKIHLNIIPLSTPGSPHWSPTLRFAHQKPVYASPLPHTCYVPHWSHSCRCYHPHNIGWGVQIISSSLFSFPHYPVTSTLLNTIILLSTLFSNALSLRPSLNVSDQVSHTFKTTGKIIIQYFSIFNFFVDSKLEEK